MTNHKFASQQTEPWWDRHPALTIMLVLAVCFLLGIAFWVCVGAFWLMIISGADFIRQLSSIPATP
jgi:hypothetical protein